MRNLMNSIFPAKNLAEQSESYNQLAAETRFKNYKRDRSFLYWIILVICLLSVVTNLVASLFYYDSGKKSVTELSVFFPKFMQWLSPVLMVAVGGFTIGGAVHDIVSGSPADDVYLNIADSHPRATVENTTQRATANTLLTFTTGVAWSSYVVMGGGSDLLGIASVAPTLTIPVLVAMGVGFSILGGAYYQMGFHRKTIEHADAAANFKFSNLVPEHWMSVLKGGEVVYQCVAAQLTRGITAAYKMDGVLKLFGITGSAPRIIIDAYIFLATVYTALSQRSLPAYKKYFNKDFDGIRWQDIDMAEVRAKMQSKYLPNGLLALSRVLPMVMLYMLRCGGEECSALSLDFSVLSANMLLWVIPVWLHNFVVRMHRDRQLVGLELTANLDENQLIVADAGDNDFQLLHSEQLFRMSKKELIKGKGISTAAYVSNVCGRAIRFAGYIYFVYTIATEVLPLLEDFASIHTVNSGNVSIYHALLVACITGFPVSENDFATMKDNLKHNFASWWLKLKILPGYKDHVRNAYGFWSAFYKAGAEYPPEQLTAAYQDLLDARENVGLTV